MSAPPFPGWEIVLAAHKSDISSPEDVVVVALHWRLLAHGLRCVGRGEVFGFGGGEQDDESLSEILPKEWGKDAAKEGAYALRYRRAEKTTDKYLLKAVLADGIVIASLVRIADEKVSTCTATAKEMTTEDGRALRNSEDVAKKVDKELLEEMFPAAGAAAAESSSSSSKKKEEEKRRDDDSDPLRIGPPRYPRMPDQSSGFLGQGGRPPFFDPVGGSDLDPLGRMGGGGMLFEPPGGGGGLGRQGFPRFDPVNPYFPNAGRGGGRGGGGHGRNYGDEMGPPGFDNDDMFG